MQQLLCMIPTRTLIVIFVLIALVPNGSCHSSDVEMTTATTPACSAEQVEEWTWVTEKAHGVKGEDPVGFYIADYPAEKGSFMNNWLPMSPYKQTLCGKLHHFNAYDGSGAEMDWNNYMLPAAGFEYFIDDVIPYKGGSGIWCKDDDWHTCPDEGEDKVCMEAEITPDESFYENPWFPKSTDTSILEGQQICVYGPWIRECNHGHRPEIHTAELTWWKEKWRGSDLFWLMAMQDDSNRFDRNDSFDIEGTPPAEWRPWAAAPMTERFSLAFELNPASGSVLRYSIGEGFARNVVTGNDPQTALDADNGTQHALKYNGRVLLRVEETQPDDNVGVTFTNVCRRPNGNLQGYLSLTTKFGIDNVGKEGYHVLYVLANKETTPFPPVNIPPSQVDTVISMKGDPSSLQPGQVGDKRGLLGSLAIDIKALKTSQDTRVEKVEFVTRGSRRELPYTSRRGNAGGIVGDLSLLEAGQLVFQLRSGKTIPTTWPGMGVAGVIQQRVSAASVAPIGSWSTIFKAAGGADVQPVAALKPMRVDRMELVATPQYAMLKNGRIGLAEDSPFVERLNEVLERGDANEISRIMGTAQPTNIEWSIKATNLTSGSLVAVESGNRTTAESVVMSEIAGKGVSKTIRIDFPATNSVYEVLITAKVSDVFGSTTLLESRVGNYFLTNDSPTKMVNALLPAVAAAAGVPETDLVAAMRPGIIPLGDPRHRNPRVRKTLVIRNVALQSADDKQISLNELAALIRGARLLR